MLKGLFQLTWLELKIFMREPLGAIGGIVFPVLAFVFLGRAFGSRITSTAATAAAGNNFGTVVVPMIVVMTIAINTILSLVTIVSIYREGGILKRLRATPLRPHTILSAHVLVKLLLTALTMALMVAAGRRYYPVDVTFPVVSFSIALLLTMLTVLSIGFLIAAMVPTARFAQPIGGLILYPMVSISGLFFPIDILPPALYAFARVLPLTFCVSLLQGIWKGDAWSAHLGDLAGMAIIAAICTALSARLFKWE